MAGGRPKKIKFNPEGIQGLLNNKPIVYSIETRGGNNIYTGSAKRGRCRERLLEHLPRGPEPVRGGVVVKVRQFGSIGEAQKLEKTIINREKPKFNKK